MNVLDIIGLARKTDGCSDVHVLGGDPVKLRVAGRPVTLDTVVDSGEIEQFVGSTLDRDALARYKRLGSCEVMIPTREGQVRLHVHNERRGVRLAIRLTAPDIPEFKNLGLPPVLGKWTDRSSGLILVCGPSGSGKTTLLTALVNKLNREQRGAIVTIENPVEYLHPQLGLYVSQIEVGRDTQSFAEGVRAAAQSDPDVMVIGEVSSQEAAVTMLEATETGHLVLASMHSQNTIQALDRLSNWLPLGVVQTQLTHTLIGIAALRLVPALAGGVVPACEILVMNDATRKIVREDRLHQLRSSMTGDGMQTLEADLKRLVADQLIARSEAERFAVYPEQL